MKFIINTSLEPEFCSLVDDQNNLIETAFFPNRRKTSDDIWEFLKRHDLTKTPLTFIGGVSGPGSFSSLRTTAGILNVLSLKFNVPIHQMRADIIVQKIIETNNISVDTFVLNSFGTSVFYPENEALIRADIYDVVTKLNNKKVFTQFLPQEKKSAFPTTPDIAIDNMPSICLEVLEAQQPQRIFEADYEFPAV